MTSGQSQDLRKLFIPVDMESELRCAFKLGSDKETEGTTVNPIKIKKNDIFLIIGMASNAGVKRLRVAQSA